MTQITEDYVSYETAALLKEKGFDWQQSPFYSEQDMDEWKQENSYQIPNPDYDPNIPFDTETITMVAPHISQSLALKWLREVHNIHVEISLETMDGTNPIYYACYSEIINFRFNNFIDYGDTYESACEVALKYALENLI